MQPTDARRVACPSSHFIASANASQAFPCFDDPALKATFSVTLIVEEPLTCLSNMDSIAEHVSPTGKKSVTFGKTPRMSSYLIAFTVGDLRRIESNAFRVPIRVYTTPGKENMGSFSLELAVKTMKLYEEKFQSEYPLPKLDFIAAPEFNGAMENWGLVIHGEKVLLVDESTSTATRMLVVRGKFCYHYHSFFFFFSDEYVSCST
jgi:aminopeptidase 2